MADDPSKPTILLGKDTSPEGLDRAALKIWKAAYRQKHGGEDPPAELERRTREALAARRRSWR